MPWDGTPALCVPGGWLGRGLVAWGLAGHQPVGGQQLRCAPRAPFFLSLSLFIITIIVTVVAILPFLFCFNY